MRSSTAWIYSIQRDALVVCVLERLVVVIDTFLVNAPVGFDGTDHMPLLPAAEFDQFGRGIPGIKQNIHRVAFGSSRSSSSTSIVQARAYLLR